MTFAKTLAVAISLAFAGPALAQPAAAAPAPTAQAATSAPESKATASNATTPANTSVAAAPVIAEPIEYGSTPGGYSIVPQVTKNGEFAKWMHDDLLMPIITAISIFVLGLLLWVVVRYRRAANPVPSTTSHNTLIEVIWTLVPVLILVGIAIPSIGLLAAQYKPVGKGAITIKAIGHQWFWTYEYPDHGGIELTSNLLPDDQAKARGEPRLLAVDERVVVPVGVPVRLLTTSEDVIHSFAVPALWTKMDAIPGRINETSFTVEKPGVYYGQCSELCGAKHGFMPIAVEAVSPADFARWVAAKGGKMPGAPEPAATAPVGAATPQAPTGAPATAPTVPEKTISNATAPATK